MEILNFNTRFANQSMLEIPVGKWIDKSVGGCGLSYLALTDTHNSIILVPRNTLIENKIQQSSKYPNLFAVNQGINKKDVINYTKKVTKEGLPIKIIITYNSFALGKVDFLLDTCRLYVDESQFLIDFATSEPKLVTELHNRLEKHISQVSFFSAHPPKREYLPNYIQDMPGLKLNWEYQTKATPYIVDTNRPYWAVGKILSDLIKKGEYTLSGLKFKKVIVFVNSVEGIKKIIEPLNSPDKIAYVVGDTIRNDSKLNDYAYRLDDCEKLPLITIGTTSLISGIDLYDDETMNIIISTSNKAYTLFDKELDIPQAITRQRNDSNPHNNKFIFIVDKVEMEDRIVKLEETYNKDFETLTKVVDNLNYLKDGGKDYTIGYENYDGFYYIKDDVFCVNDAMLKARKYIFEQLYRQYEQGYNVMSTNKGVQSIIVNVEGLKNPSYSDYASYLSELTSLGDKLTLIKEINNKDWANYLTYGLEQDKILLNVKQAKEFYESRKDYLGITLTIRNTFKLNEFYSLEHCKTTLQSIYDKKDLKRKAKATDLKEFFEITNQSTYINNIKVQGIVIKT